ncbi:MAG: ice-binding family protein [Opitutaceae bacterium]|nr:ice-binding family protein [Opitutaceae bacterium]
MKSRYSGLLASAGFAALSYIASAATAPSLGLAESFAVLGGTAVTITDSVVNGDVGVDLNGTVTQTNSTISGTVHVGDTVAQDAYTALLTAYFDFSTVLCEQTISGDLAGQSLLPGVYCVDGASTTTGGVLTLLGSSTDTWIFMIKEASGRPPTPGTLTGTNFTVVGMTPSGETWTCNNNVFWWTADAATLTDSVLIGNILAGTDITVTGGSLGGQALARGAVTLLTGTSVNVCDTPPPPPIKVTGGGQIPVPDTTSKGRATFGFNAQPNTDGTATGHFNYVNHVTGLHVDGPVDHIEVVIVDGLPTNTVLFSGTWNGGSFIVTVEDNGEPGSADEFGITVIGDKSETTLQRVISKGNIQFH